MPSIMLDIKGASKVGQNMVPVSAAFMVLLSLGSDIGKNDQLEINQKGSFNHSLIHFTCVYCQ